MEEQQLVPPHLLYRNLLCYNRREPRRIHIAPPPGMELARTDALEALVELRIVPNYTAPFYAPVLFCAGTGSKASVMQVSFHEPLALTDHQSETLVRHSLSEAPLTPLQLGGDAYRGACLTIALVRYVLERLDAPTCASELRHWLREAEYAVPGDREELNALYVSRFDVLDQSWLRAIQWARLRHTQPETQLAGAQTLHRTVRRRYEERLQSREEQQRWMERTLKNVLEDYRFCSKKVI